MKQDELIETLFTDLGFSQSFCEVSKEMGLFRLKDVLLLEPKELTEKKGYSYRWLGELVDRLVKEEALHLLQPFTGNRPN